MERSEFVERYNNLLITPQTFDQISELIAEYCRISNKSEENIENLLTFLKLNPFIITELLNLSLEGLSRYHNITSLISNDKIIRIY